VARNDDAVLVDHGDGRVPVQPERAGQLGVRVGERGPRPAVLAQERFRLVPVVRDVQPDELVLGMALREPRVGDRLAVTDGSPGRPDVDEDGLPAKIGEREPIAVECGALERDALGGGARRRFSPRPAAPATTRDGNYEQEQGGAPHPRSP